MLSISENNAVYSFGFRFNYGEEIKESELKKIQEELINNAICKIRIMKKEINIIYWLVHIDAKWFKIEIEQKQCGVKIYNH